VHNTDLCAWGKRERTETFSRAYQARLPWHRPIGARGVAQRLRLGWAKPRQSRLGGYSTKVNQVQHISSLLPSTSRLLDMRARGLRSAPTESEGLLWSKLSGKRLGVAFKRQVPVGRYIADFVAPSLRLAVEVDGGYHSVRLQKKRDLRRDREFRRLGYSVMRFPAFEVMRDVETVVSVIRQGIEAIEDELDERARGWALYEDAFDARLEGRASFWEA
jgi:very-short-patch-repair endonuclease